MPVWTYSIIDGVSPGTQNIFTAIVALPNLTITPTKMHYFGAGQLVADFKGTGIHANPSDEVTGGTITSLTIKGTGGATALTATGLNVSATEIFNLMVLENAGRVAGEMFSGKDKIYGTTLGEDLYGFGNNDTLFGGGGRDNLSGGNGADSLYGGSGKDTLSGDGGNNLLAGGAGNDTLLGHDGGKDRFVFNTAFAASNVDTIVDFNSLNDDRILLDNDIFKALGTPGALTNAKFHVGIAAADASDRIIYDSATGKLFYDRDGTGAATKKLFAIAGGDGPPPILTAGDFQIIN